MHNKTKILLFSPLSKGTFNAVARLETKLENFYYSIWKSEFHFSKKAFSEVKYK